MPTTPPAGNDELCPLLSTIPTARLRPPIRERPSAASRSHWWQHRVPRSETLQLLASLPVQPAMWLLYRLKGDGAEISGLRLPPPAARLATRDRLRPYRPTGADRRR